MNKRIIISFVCMLLPLSTWAAEDEKDKSFGQQVGETVGGVEKDATNVYQDTKEFVSDGTEAVVEGSKEAYQGAKEGTKQFWDDVKKGYREATE